MRKGVRKLHKKGDSTILLIIKLKFFFLSSSMKWVRHVARMVEIMATYKILVEGKSVGGVGELKDQY